jgi:DNA-binding response OmpR family regulator
MAKILVIEDDKNFLFAINEALITLNHTIETATDGNEALDKLWASEYDLIILDWELPHVSGLDVCKQFRSRGGNTPILFLTGRSHIDSKEDGFDAGADDYLTKPFHVRELVSRVKALLRRPSAISGGDILTAGDVVLNRVSYTVTRGGEEIKLLRKEFAVLEFFMRNPDRVFSVDALLNRVWSSESEAGPEALRQTLSRLRAKLEKPGQPQLICTVTGVGYKLKTD